MAKRLDPRNQFSKLLARWTSAFWFLYMTWLSVIFIFQPSAALYCVYMAVIATAVMLTNVIAYTRNSIAEKMALTLLDKTKIELSLKKPEDSVESSSEDTLDDTSEESSEEGENG